MGRPPYAQTVRDVKTETEEILVRLHTNGQSEVLFLRGVTAVSRRLLRQFCRDVVESVGFPPVGEDA